MPGADPVAILSIRPLVQAPPLTRHHGKYPTGSGSTRFLFREFDV
jgi:hypothetical protein